MNARVRSGQANSDPWGRFFLALLSVAFVTFGFLNAGEWIGVPAIICGFIAGILFAFHSRVRGLKIFDKVEMPIAADVRVEEPQRKQPPPQPASEEVRPTSVGQITRAAQQPDTSRRRDGRRRV